MPHPQMTVSLAHQNSTVFMPQPGSYDVIGNILFKSIATEEVPHVVMGEVLAIRKTDGMAGVLQCRLGGLVREDA